MNHRTAHPPTIPAGVLVAVVCVLSCHLGTLYAAIDLEETDIVVNNASLANRTTTFYEIDNTINTTLADNETRTTTEEPIDLHSDEFWDVTTVSPVPTTTNTYLDDTFVIGARAAVTSSTRTSTRTTTTTTATPTSSSTPKPTTTTRTATSSTPSSTVRPPPSPTTVATVRLHSNIVTVKPDTSTPKPKKHKPDNGPKLQNEPNGLPDDSEEADNVIWKMVLHGTNMNSEELRMCNKTLVEVHFKSYSKRKIARTLKKNLDKKFSKWGYRFSVILSSTSRNTMGKSLHGVWASISLNGVHYFITATHRVLDGLKLKEEQIDKIENWAAVHAIGARNMTGYRKYNRIALKLKTDLDRQYGNGNVWSVIIVKNRYLVKAKVLEDAEYHIEFTRLNNGHFIVFRGGENISDTNRNARELPASSNKDDESSEHSDINSYGYISPR